MNNHIQRFQLVLPIAIGAVGFLGSAYAVFEGRTDWNPIAFAVLSMALCGAGTFSTISFSKTGIVIKTVGESLGKSLGALEENVKNQEVAIQELSKRVESVATVTAGLSKISQAPSALAAQAETLSAQPNDLTSALQSLGASVNDVVAGVSAAKETLGNLIGYFGTDEEPTQKG